MELRPLFKLKAMVDTPQVSPDAPYGVRRFIPVTCSEFNRDRVSGTILPGGADCQLIRADGVADLDVRITFKTDDGAIILMKD